MSFFKKKEFEILNNTDQLVRDGRVGITFTKLSESFSHRELPMNAPKPTLYHSKFDAIVGADKLTRRSLDLSSKEKLIGFNLKEIKFLSKDWEKTLEDEELKKYIYDLICSKVILKYQSQKLGIDDVIETDRVVDE